VSYGVWRSLVARFVRDEEVAGSNPVTPTSVSLVRSSFVKINSVVGPKRAIWLARVCPSGVGVPPTLRLLSDSRALSTQ
jgi:hypothetical protein